ncbi:ABC transporter ATP-binding protein [Rhodoferax sp. AJA081-3]|uniref:ABC transporter ATP-binding protein n=1 Tax=Rhodoferax sp. AJA081-3 TaxID=2752316 RepID=UPI001FD727DF|nr:ABC transporter ATP-binding protein [Rhodoferax sp. AJA081-3]
MIQAVIEVHDLTFDYPGFRALDRVSLSITPGSVTALVGPNGAGKTTLLRCIAALDTPLSGSVRVMGLDVYESPREVHRLMGYLSDNFGLYSDLTVAQGLEYAARSQGLPDAAVPAAVRATAQRMGLGDKLGNLAHTLSRGQRQRLAIGQAIIHNPKVLLLDEPASGLDPEARSALADVFKALQAQGMSLLVSSHILAELDEYSTHMLALNQGRVLEHRALAASAGASSPGTADRMLRLEFENAADATAPWLQSQPHVVLQRVQGTAVDISFSSDRSAQAALVRACVTEGHALVSVASITENLQQSYLKSLAAERATGTTPRMQP